MLNVSLKPLIKRLSPYCQTALTQAAQACIERGNYEISPEHLLLIFLDEPTHDFHTILKYFEIDSAQVLKALHQVVSTASKSQAERPIYSGLLLDWMQAAWMLASVEFDQSEIRSGILVLSLLVNRPWLFQLGLNDVLGEISVDQLRDSLSQVLVGTTEAQEPSGDMDALSGDASTQTSTYSKLQNNSSQQHEQTEALKKYTQNFTELARQGKIDPVFCRDQEIRQVIDILGRRRKNNPLIVGEAGVGKTALVEGLALKIVEQDVPESLLDVDLLSLDLQAMQAGASVRGEFEQRLKFVVDAVKSSPKPIVLFIDEVHTLMGAGGSAGTGDAANILKPALARGELRSLAATTWSEYKKYIEKDAALERRFQLVKLDEPSPEQASIILRGLREIYEKAHGIFVRDDAIEAAARLSARYLTGRRLPDKAVDVLDTVCSRVKLSLNARPAQLAHLDKQIQIYQREHKALKRDQHLGVTANAIASEQRLMELERNIDQVESEKVILEQRWQEEKISVTQILTLRKAVISQEATSQEATSEKSQQPDQLTEENLEENLGENPEENIGENVKENLEAMTQSLLKLQADDPLIHYEACPQLVAEVIADWTGIPLGNMLKDEAQSILEFRQQLTQRIKGQSPAISLLDRGIRSAKTGLNNPNAPLGVFLFVGPSGVGKTETAIAMADLLFGGERFLTTLNMSEFMDKHSSSKLIGSAPGLVGYGEGGALTEAVRQRPYSVVLLDEVEKADAEVMNLFYQVFDKGQLADGESRVVDFKNTLMIMTSNLASDEIMAELNQTAQSDDNENNYDSNYETLIKKIRPILNKHFKPALVARMTIVPFMPLGPEIIQSIVQLKLEQIVTRVKNSQKIHLSYDQEVIQAITDRCTEVETGARNIEHILSNQLLPAIATEILQSLGTDKTSQTLHISWNNTFIVKGLRET